MMTGMGVAKSLFYVCLLPSPLSTRGVCVVCVHVFSARGMHIFGYICWVDVSQKSCTRKHWTKAVGVVSLRSTQIDPQYSYSGFPGLTQIRSVPLA